MISAPNRRTAAPCSSGVSKPYWLKESRNTTRPAATSTADLSISPSWCGSTPQGTAQRKTTRVIAGSTHWCPDSHPGRAVDAVVSSLVIKFSFLLRGRLAPVATSCRFAPAFNIARTFRGGNSRHPGRQSRGYYWNREISSADERGAGKPRTVARRCEWR